jgi:hypothetical protein
MVWYRWYRYPCYYKRFYTTQHHTKLYSRARHLQLHGLNTNKTVLTVLTVLAVTAL